MEADWVLAVYLLATGLAVGSFLGVVADRVPEGRSVVKVRSACTVCGRVLRWWELVPVMSYLGLRGRCHGCGVRIPQTLVWVEVGTGLLFLAAALQYGASVETVVVLAYVSFLVAVALIDFERKLILNKMVYPAAIIGLALAPLTPWAPSSPVMAWAAGVAGAAAGFGLLLVVYVASRGGMGAGDVKLAGVVGLMTGLQGVAVALFVGFVVGGVIGVALLLLRLRGRKDAIPFGPYLALGAATALLLGTAPLDWYLELLRFP